MLINRFMLVLKNRYLRQMKASGFYILIFLGFLAIGNQTLLAQDKSLPDGKTQFFYPTGKVSSEGNLLKGKPEGYWKSFYENGELKSEGNRVNYKLDSLWKFYSDSGVVRSELSYLAGMKQGEQKNYYENGKIFSIETFVNDLKHGNTIYFYENGQMQKTIPFVEGIENGIGREYSSDGIIITLIEYKKSYVVKEERFNRTDRAGQRQGVWKELFEDSSVTGSIIIKSEGIYREDKKQQIWKTYDVNGKVLKEELYINGEVATRDQARDLAKLEIKREYYPNGKVKSVGSYNKEVPEGVFREYTADGKIYDAKVYKAGKLMRQGLLGEDGLEQGPWKEYYESGKLRGEGEYEKGIKIKKWKYYYEKGVLEQEGNYKNGKPEGVWNWYYSSRNIWREESYLNGKENGWMREYSDNDSSKVDWNVIAEGNFIEGKREGFWKFHSDELIIEGKYVDGKEEGEWRVLFYDASKRKEQMQLDFIGSYFGGDENGLHKYFYFDGKPREERNYRMGIRDGIWKRWDKEGNLILTTLYEEGKEMRYDGVKLPEIDAE